MGALEGLVVGLVDMGDAEGCLDRLLVGCNHINTSMRMLSENPKL